MQNGTRTIRRGQSLGERIPRCKGKLLRLVWKTRTTNKGGNSEWTQRLPLQ